MPVPASISPAAPIVPFTLPLKLPPKVAAFQPPKWTRWVVHVACFLLVAGSAGVTLSDLFLGTRILGANPIKEGEHLLGEWTLRMLMITLFVTPIRQLTGWNWLQKYRRIFGVWAFVLGCTHLLAWAVLDVELDWGDIQTDIMKRWYITIGMAAWLLMLPLAVTSTAGMVKRLGKKWVPLHKLIYPIVVLGCIHFFMAVKKDYEDAIIFAAFFAGLFAWRLFMWWRKRATAARAAAPARAAA
ncbi:MAG: sulfoxide reductase heme-binding subunit YedZ [Gemmatimonadetes bacterium]|nr:sulfoxide reductase heme-binding subunit YedZ [Gemmatimonadota bacterium]